MASRLARFSNLPSALQFEDALLFVWLLLIEPLLQRFFFRVGAANDYSNLQPGDAGSVTVGLFFIIAGLCACVALATRAQGEPAEDLDFGSLGGYAYMPMMAGLSLVEYFGLRALGSTLADGVLGLVALFVIVVTVAHKWLPQMPEIHRRLLMTPVILASSLIFSSMMNSILRGFSFRDVLFSYGQPEFGELAFGAGILLLAALVFYVIFVFAPRQVGTRGGSFLDWATRFLIYILGVILNVGAVRALGI